MMGGGGGGKTACGIGDEGIQMGLPFYGFGVDVVKTGGQPVGT